MPHLARALARFADLTQGLADPQLDKPWHCEDYDEGVRFAFFRTYEELSELAARLNTRRASDGIPVTTAQRLLTSYHRGFRDLDAVLLGLDCDLLDQAPGEGEWGLRRILGHIIGADLGFWGLCTHTLGAARAGAAEAPAFGDDELTAFVQQKAGGWETFEAAIVGAGTFRALVDYYHDQHRHVLADLAGVTEKELDAPARYWESRAYPLRFRLGRFDSHLRQHTVQVEKTVQALCGAPGEARRLLRLLYAALAEVEATTIGAPPFGEEERAALARTIDTRVDTIALALKA